MDDGCYSMRRRVAFHETDAAGIVHFANYFRYAEEAETAALHELGLLLWGVNEAYALPRVHVEADYACPLRFWQEVEVRACITRVGESSLSWCFEMRDAESQELCARVSWVSARRDATGAKAPYSTKEQGLLARFVKREA